MNETSKTKRLWSQREWDILTGTGIDIGCGHDPVTPTVRCFDINDGDANDITQFVHEQFDFVFSSHCLEHMRHPREALAGWWQLVRPGGYLFLIVPDEDLYEQGVFPSRFNPDHKATFTISKRSSWSPVSINLLDLVRGLPDCEIVSIELQDEGYDRQVLRFGTTQQAFFLVKMLMTFGFAIRALLTGKLCPAPQYQDYRPIVDQTHGMERLAQIQCIAQKRLGSVATD